MPLLPLARHGRAGGLRQRDPGRVHGQSPVQPARAAGAVRGRSGGDRGGPPGPADHQHRGLRSRTSSNSVSRWRSSSNRSRTSGCRCSSPLRTLNPLPCRPTRSRRSASANTCAPCWPRRSSRTRSRSPESAMSQIGRRLMQPPLSLTVAGLRSGDRRRRADLRRHRRPVHLPGRRKSSAASAKAG